MGSDKINSWLTLGANLGVLVGIILILMELNQNAALTRAQMVQSRADNLIGSYETRMHSEFWPEIRAKQRAAASTVDWLDSLDPVEYERVQYLYFREVNDIRSQYYMHLEGLMPEEIWQEATRGQIVRMMYIRDAMQIGCNTDTSFNKLLNQIAAEEGAPECEGRDPQTSIYFGTSEKN